MAFDSILSGRRPTFAFQVSPGRGAVGIGGGRSILVVGGITGTGTGVVDTLYQLTSADDASEYAGVGGLVHHTVDSIYKQDPALDVWLVLADRPGGGGAPTQATQSSVLSFSAGVVSAGITVQIAYGGVVETVTVDDGLALDAVGAALVAALNANTLFPGVFSYVDLTDTLTVTAKDYGAEGLDLDLTVLSNEGNLSFAAWAAAAGANTLDWEDACEAAMAAREFDFIVPCTNRILSLNPAGAGWSLFDDVVAAAGPTVMKPIFLVIGNNGATDPVAVDATYIHSKSMDLGTTDKDSELGWWVRLAYAGNCPQPASVIAGAFAGANASKTKSNRNKRWCHPVEGCVMKGLLPPWEISDYVDTAEACLNGGVSPIVFDRSTGVGRLVWPVSCKHVTGGVPDFRVSDTNIMDVLVFAAKLFRQRLVELDFETYVDDDEDGNPPEDSPATAISPSQAVAFLRSVYLGPELYGAGYVDKTYKDAAGETHDVVDLYAGRLSPSDAGAMDLQPAVFVTRWARQMGVLALEQGRG